MGGSGPPNWHVPRGPPEFLAASCTCGLSPPTHLAARPSYGCGSRMNYASGGMLAEAQATLPTYCVPDCY